MSENNESAVAKQGLGMGGLGQFDEESFVGALVGSDETKGTATGEDIRDAMGNVRPKMPKIKVKHSGAAIFVKEDGTRLETLTGVIVAHTFHNSYFGDKSFEEHEEGERPPCFSNDAASVGETAEDPQAPSCLVCPRNRDARDREARQTAFERDRDECCKNYFSLAFSVPGEEVPYVVQFPNSSFKAWGAYVQAIGSNGRFLPHEVATRITLTNRKGAGGSEYSEAKFEMLGALPPEVRAEFSSVHDNYRAMLRRAAADAERVEESKDAKAAVAEARAAEEKAAEGPAAL